VTSHAWKASLDKTNHFATQSAGKAQGPVRTTKQEKPASIHPAAKADGISLSNLLKRFAARKNAGLILEEF